MIICQVCNSTYKSALPNDMQAFNQGIDCACSVVQEGGQFYIIGGYGSSAYDLMSLKFIKPVPDGYVNADPICDNCVKSLMDQKIVELDRDLMFGDWIGDKQ